MTSPPKWTWVWANSGSWWWTGRPGMLRFMGSQRVGHDRETELNWKPPRVPVPNLLMLLYSSPVTSHPFPVPSVPIFLLPIALSTDYWLCPAWLKSSLTSHVCSSYWTGWLHLKHKITLSLKLYSFGFWVNSFLELLESVVSSLSFHLFFFFNWLCHVACGILVPWPGIEPMPPAMEAWNLNHWTIREVPDHPLNLKVLLGLHPWSSSVNNF